VGPIFVITGIIVGNKPFKNIQSNSGEKFEPFGTPNARN
jgi:hypothetical protein